MADGSITGRLSGAVDAIRDISTGLGNIESVKVRVGGQLYEVWPPAQGFEVQITNARTLGEPVDEFSVEITDARLDSPPKPAMFDVEITDSRLVSA